MGCNQSAPTATNATAISNPTMPTTTNQQVGQDGHGRVSVTSYNGSYHGQSDQMSLPPIAEPTADVGKTFVARYAYQARTAEDLSFEKGEQLIVSGRGSNDNREVILELTSPVG